MEISSYLEAVLQLANIFISLFVLVFAYIFIKNTEAQNDRKPWIYLIIAIIIFFVFEVAGFIGGFGSSVLPGLRDFFRTLFIAIILYVFVYQYYLISRSKRILIKRKESVSKDILGTMLVDPGFSKNKTNYSSPKTSRLKK